MFHGIIKYRDGKNLLAYLYPPAVCAGYMQGIFFSTAYLIPICQYNYSFYAIFDINEQFNFSRINKSQTSCIVTSVFSPAVKTLTLSRVYSPLSRELARSTLTSTAPGNKYCNTLTCSSKKLDDERKKRKKVNPRKLGGPAFYHDGKSYQKIFQNSLVHLYP